MEFKKFLMVSQEIYYNGLSYLTDRSQYVAYSGVVKTCLSCAEYHRDLYSIIYMNDVCLIFAQSYM